MTEPLPDQTVHSGRRDRILLVEDNYYNRELMQDFLQVCCGFTVSTAATGSEALACLATCQPDLILLDLRLPDIDGFAVLKELARRSPRIPVFVISACAQPADQERAIGLGALRYFVKPTCLNELCQAIELILNPPQSCQMNSSQSMQ